ncbi:MAG TPA: MMPL family transporter [Actinomycetota bacterium]|nr:MMPL family transporter [Actinomycetota bacterium]
MIAAVARFVVRRPWVVVAAWVAIVGGLFAAAPALGDVVTQDNAAFLGDDAPSVRGAVALSRIWPRDEVSNTAALVFRRDEGLTPADERLIRSVEEWLRSPAAPDVVKLTQSPYSRPELREALRSEDGRVIIVVVGFTTPPFQPDTNEAVAAIREHVRPRLPEGLEFHVTGNAGVAADQASAIQTAVERTTAITLFLVIAILLWVYRSPVTAMVPLFTVGAALAASRGLVALVAEAGLQVSSLVETFMVVIVFGAGTDYCLFIVSRYKEELGTPEAAAAERPGRPRLVGTMAVIGGVIASSAAAVVVGFGAQSVAQFGMYRTTGPAMAIAVVVTLVAGLTLTPALLAALGRWAFWPWGRGRRAVEAA